MAARPDTSLRRLIVRLCLQSTADLNCRRPRIRPLRTLDRGTTYRFISAAVSTLWTDRFPSVSPPGTAWRNHGRSGQRPQRIWRTTRLLSGTASWSGRLLGFTPTVEVIAGTADLAMDLGTLNGQLEFANLESWAPNAAPGQIGSGTIWGDGDLQYTVGVRGNTFVQNGGDEGTVTGAFFGSAHEAMGGVVERVDLTAGFGGSR